MAHETLKQQLDRLMAPNFGTHAIWESNPGVPGSLAAARDAEKSRIDDFIKPAEVMNDSLLTYDNEIQTFTDSGVIIPVSDSVVSIDDIPLEYVLKGEAEDGGDLYLPSNGKSFADVLMAHEASKGNEVSGSFFTKGVDDILGNDRDSDAQRDYLTKGTAVFSDGTFEETEGRDFHTHLAEKAETARLAEAQKDRFVEILDRQDDEKISGDAQGKRNFDGKWKNLYS